MKKASFAVFALAGIAPIAAQAQTGPAWTYETTSGLNMTIPAGPPGSFYHPLGDIRRVRLNSAVVDGQGLVYFTISNGNNRPGSPGGLTIYNPVSKTKIDVDVSNVGTAPYTGGLITKLVVAGDGKVYGLMNWLEIVSDGSVGHDPANNNYGASSKVIRIHSNGTVDVVKDYQPVDANPWRNKIGGLTVGSDGNLYWWFAGSTMGGGSGDYKRKILYRYIWSTNTVQERQDAGANPPDVITALAGCNGGGGDGYEQKNRLLNFEYVGPGADGKDFFVVVGGLGNSGWAADSIRWDECRSASVNGLSQPNWGRNWMTATAYDPIRKKLWAGGIGTGFLDSSPTPVEQGTNIITRWNGDPNNTGLFTATPAGSPTEGIVSADIWHANGNAPDTSGVGNGGPYWVNTLAVNLVDGRGWMSYGAQIPNTLKPIDGNYQHIGDGDCDEVNRDCGRIGNVYSVGGEDGQNVNTHGAYEGRPHDFHPTDAANANQVVALAFGANKVYAVTADLINGRFNLFSRAIAGACNDPAFDVDGDSDVDSDDYGWFQACYTGPNPGPGEFDRENCRCADRNNDSRVDTTDLGVFLNCASGPDVPANPDCD